MDYSDLIKDFLDDAEGHLKAFDSALLSLEKNGDDHPENRDIIIHTLGSLHTLKGNSGMMGFDSLKTFIHQLEEMLKQVNDKEVKLSTVIEHLFESANSIRQALQAIEKDPSHNPELTEDILSLQHYKEDPGSVAKRQAVDVTSYLGTKTDFIKVNFNRLDTLLNLVGELVIYKTRLNQIEGRIKAEFSNKSLLTELNEGLELMGKTTAGLQEGIMQVRMLPVRNVFTKFPRMVRDLGKAQKKDIDLTFEGEDTELDKTIIDELEEPLLHIIRNAIDHGVEPVKERIDKGKRPKGNITLSAMQESNYVIIKVTDDGKGIDFEQARELAVERGLIKSEDSFDKEALVSLLFSAGFSTRREVTDVSGRGVGLDVVSKNISKLNGQIVVDSLPDKGTTFTIKLPLSLAIIQALMAEVSGEVYAIPMSAIDESIKVREEDIHVINNHEVIRFRERVLPVIRLSEFFGREDQKLKRFYLVIIGRAEKRLAIAVDSLRGQQDIVIKPLDETFGKSHGIAGASILGDGRIVLIIDTLSFWKSEMKNLENFS
jgi:two-component system chemotaxis sensor kinase CheA